MPDLNDRLPSGLVVKWARLRIREFDAPAYRKRGKTSQSGRSNLRQPAHLKEKK
jgi:hypothetical protein